MKRYVMRFAMVGLGIPLVVVTLGCGGVVDDEAETLFMDSLGNTSITVFPAFVREGETPYDQQAAETIGSFFDTENLASATVVDTEVPVTGSWHSNQSLMLRESAEAFSIYVREHPIETSYALLAEYLWGGLDQAIGVHAYLIDAEGTVAYAILLNSHHQAFNDADLTTTAGCTELVTEILREDLISIGSD